jgi:hypothetical protein
MREGALLKKLRLRNMTASARGTVEEPGRNVKAKVGLNNRSISCPGRRMWRDAMASTDASMPWLIIDGRGERNSRPQEARW